MLLDQWDLILPFGEALSNDIWVILRHIDQPVRRWFITWWVNLQVVNNASLWISLLVAQPSDAFIFWLLEHKDRSRFDSHGLEHSNLCLSIAEALEDPAIDLAVWLLESLLDEWIQNSIRNWRSSLDAL